MKSTLLTAVIAWLVAAAWVAAQAQTGDYCKETPNEPECYCQLKPNEAKCLKFFGANPGFSSRGSSTSSILDGTKTQQTQQKVEPPAYAEFRSSDYILFIHTGAPKGSVVPDVKTLIERLKNEGYVVRGADGQSDDVGGSGIDYFREVDKTGADRIATSVNDWLKANGKADMANLKARRQTVSNSAGFIGVWIFGRPR